ncbi:hypothetical protein GCM10010182_28170 [Actinomadura cremea]|nr:hypothetical protein GCM10010182_28170 [Actinomadura cremea]
MAVLLAADARPLHVLPLPPLAEPRARLGQLPDQRIPGTRRAANARANAAAAGLGLDAAVFERLEELVPPGAAAGAQGNAAYMANIDA